MFNADQHFWFARTQGFTKAILSGNLKETYQNPKPGVTVMWLSGFTLESFLQLYELKYKFRPFIYTYDTYNYVDIAVKLPLVTLTFLSLFLMFKWLQKIFGREISIITLVLLGVQPYYIGISRYFHGDGTLTAFMLLSAFSVMTFVKTKEAKYLVISAICTGFSFLTKMQGIYLFAYIPLSILIGSLINKNNFKRLIINFLLWVFIALLTIFISFPALWVAPVSTIKSMFTEAQVVTEEGRNGGDGSNLVYAKAIPKIFSPFNLVLFPIGLLFLGSNFIKKSDNDKIYYLMAVFFIIFYFVQMGLVFQKSERYLLPLFPFVSLIGAYGLTNLIKVFSLNNFKNNLIIFVLALTFVSCFYTLTFAPHYTAMAEEAPWGSLYVEAANYLNKKENANNLHVVANPKEHTFRPFFKGKTYGKGETLNNNRQPDYVVAANINYLPVKYSYCKKEHEIVFKKKVFWEIYRCK
jgi:4-amino-4-deoxy-L-arabinose transferase-like glycosyltransferase